MIDWFLVSFFSLVTACITIAVLTPIAENVGLVDVPNHRKKHTGNVPLIGGIAIFVVLLIAISLFLPNSKQLNLYLISCAFMVLIGALDDYHDLSAGVRLVAQVLIASIMIFGAEVYIADLGNLFGTGNIHLGVWGIPITYLAVLGAINAFNMSDGIDGLVGGLGFISISSIGLLLFQNGNTAYSTVALIFSAALFGFLLFNIRAFTFMPKVFMGDAGSMMLGLSVVWLLIVGSQGEEAAFNPVTALWIIAVPLIDMATIMIRRIKKKRSPLQADREHLHHIFLRAGASSKRALSIICGLALLLAAVGCFGSLYNISEQLLFAAFIALSITYFYIISHIWILLRRVKKFWS